MIRKIKIFINKCCRFINEKLNKLNNPKINHINFYKLLNNNQNLILKFIERVIPIHLNETPHNEIFISEILKYIGKF